MSRQFISLSQFRSPFWLGSIRCVCRLQCRAPTAAAYVGTCCGQSCASKQQSRGIYVDMIIWNTTPLFSVRRHRNHRRRFSSFSCWLRKISCLWSQSHLFRLSLLCTAHNGRRAPNRSDGRARRTRKSCDSSRAASHGFRSWRDPKVSKSLRTFVYFTLMLQLNWKCWNFWQRERYQNARNGRRGRTCERASEREGGKEQTQEWKSLFFNVRIERNKALRFGPLEKFSISR